MPLAYPKQGKRLDLRDAAGGNDECLSALERLLQSVCIFQNVSCKKLVCWNAFSFQFLHSLQMIKICFSIEHTQNSACRHAMGDICLCEICHSKQ